MLPPEAPDPRAVLAAFGCGGRATAYAPVEGGWSNRVLRLRTHRDDLAVKELRNPWGVDDWRDWLDEGWRLERAALDAGITGAEPLPAPDGGCVVEVDRADGSGTCWVRAHRWVEGAGVPREPVTPAVARWAGAAVATVHRLALRPLRASVYAGLDPLATVDAWPDLVARARDAGAMWAQTLEDALPVVQRAAALLEIGDPADAVLVHGDLDQRNLLLAARGPVLLDWDVVLPTAPSHDLARAAVTLAAWRDPGIARAVLDGHAAAAGTPTSLRPADLGPALAARLGWVRFTVDRLLATGVGQDDAAGHEVASLLKATARQVEISERIGEWLEGRSST